MIYAAFFCLLALRVAASGLQQVVYWGQLYTEPPLRHFCHPGQGIDIIPIAFIFDFGASSALPSGTLGPCDISDPYNPSPECHELMRDISYCQSQHKQILISLGGALGSYGVASHAQADLVAEQLFGMFGPPPPPEKRPGKYPRPFADVAVDGFDFDIETPGPNDYDYVYMVRRFRELFRAAEPRNRHLPPFIITGAPQCVVPDANMGEMILNAKFDKLFVQFYNTPQCSARGKISGYGPDGGHFTFEKWHTFVQGALSRSKGTELYIGLPASTEAANVDDMGRSYWLRPKGLLRLVNEFRGHKGFKGVMLWNADQESLNVIHGCTYSQQVASILRRRKICRR